MRLGDIANADAQRYGKPLDGVRVLAAEQMQALPYATQLLARLGAEVVKVEHPVHGESGRGSTPAMLDPEGRTVGATYLRNNLDKRSVGIDLKSPEGRDLFLALVPRFDVVAENFKAGTMDRLGLGYDVIAARAPAGDLRLDLGLRQHRRLALPRLARVRVDRRGDVGHLRVEDRPDGPPVTIPVGALGDISSALFAVIGILAALRHRDRTGEGQYVDIAMLDAMVAMTDVVTNFWSLGVRPEPDKGARRSSARASAPPTATSSCRSCASTSSRSSPSSSAIPSGTTIPRFATRAGWGPNLETVIRPAVEAWASQRTKVEAARELTAAGIAAGPSNHAPDVIADPHVAARNMLVEMPRTDGVDRAGAGPGQPGEAVEGGRGPRDRGCRGSASTPTRCSPTSSASTPTRIAGLRDRGVIT